MLSQIEMLHPNANANQVWVFRCKKSQVRAMAHDEMVRRGMFFTTGEIRSA